MFEAEIKYAADSAFAPIGAALPETVYRDVYFDTPDDALAAAGRELRLRACDGTSVLTCKRPPFDAATASKEELETVVADGAAMAAILHSLGYAPRIALSKRVRRFRDAFHGLALDIAVVTVDFAPETFVEIEHLAHTREAAQAALPHIRAYAAAHGLTRECPRAYTAMFQANLAQKEHAPCTRTTPPSPRT
ncbi:class IV adenylate cyclase [Solidesulfovibrio sp.]|uniref:class IV adenylate cyclase n=1 Tax=Solidesulfovibrio sp. TaxID=2910990 RepID=UPI002B21748D|nr:class IV adenylate cyclase [Solidesulfovibrio sp.]MEA5089804.1 class IV adenylate cyclase [Solidesulfovibrio sp.]